ncbi:MAG: hypothetical protein HOF89_01325 [Candidatus Nitrosopelagicus sp.]|jgi:hypothetical protein|nr:hypothetical protein [Candidatus Nitrosopelagicus sp.]
MFGKKKTQDAQGNPIYKAKYVGGHKMFPKSRDVEITLLADKIKISRINFDIKYSTITNVENVDEKKIELKRIVLLGIAGALWKKKHLYTVIDFVDEIDQTQSVLFDFAKNIEEAQQLIYDKTINNKN